MITINGEMKTEKIVKDSSGNVISNSKQMNHFSSSQPIPVEVEQTVRNINYEDDVLTVELERKK